jgi:type IV secretion system protein VirB9
MKKLILIIAYLIITIQAHAKTNKAIIYPEPMAHNDKIVTYIYRPDYIYNYVGTYEYQAHIKLQAGETVSTIAMGNTSGWEIVESGNRIFLRPLNKYAKTNMTLITNRRLYQFLLDAKSVESMNDPAVFFEARFSYPEDLSNFTVLQTEPDVEEIIKEDAEELLYNYNYSISGPDKIVPVKVFDDGEFTYFEFSNKHTEIPAIFYVDTDGYEGLVNYRVEGDYIIIERLAEMFTLRHGTDTVCVYNEEMQQKKQQVKAKK